MRSTSRRVQAFGRVALAQARTPRPGQGGLHPSAAMRLMPCRWRKSAVLERPPLGHLDQLAPPAPQGRRGPAEPRGGPWRCAVVGRRPRGTGPGAPRPGRPAGAGGGWCRECAGAQRRGTSGPSRRWFRSLKEALYWTLRSTSVGRAGSVEPRVGDAHPLDAAPGIWECPRRRPRPPPVRRYSPASGREAVQGQRPHSACGRSPPQCSPDGRSPAPPLPHAMPSTWRVLDPSLAPPGPARRKRLGRSALPYLPTVGVAPGAPDHFSLSTSL